VAFDVNYHQAGDTLANTNTGAWIQNTKALAHAAAVYARNLTGIPREAGVTRRGVKVSRDQTSKKRAAFGHVFLSS
jgi:3D (Asp-Asp-Asp) domain-containing protein